jgi:hypothetical protein
MPITYNVAPQTLIQVNSGKEASWGAAASPATAKWMLVKKWPTFKPYRKSTVYEEVRGALTPAWVSSILKKGGEWKIPGYFSFEDSIFLGHSVFSAVSAAGSAPAVWTYNGPTSTQPPLQSFSFEFNQPNFMTYAIGCIGNKLTIKGAAESWWEYELAGFAMDVDMATAQTQTALSDRAIEPVLMGNTVLSMDTAASAIGTTAFAGTLVDFTYTIENALKALYTAGNLMPTQTGASKMWATTLEMSIVNTSSVRTFVNTNMIAGNLLRIQIKGTGTGSKQAVLNFTGVLSDDIELYGEKDGFQLYKIKLSGIWDTTAAMYSQMIISNTVLLVP